MQSALDTFRAQREAADQIHARLTEVGQLLEQLSRQVDAVAGNADLRAVLRDERNWLHQAQILLADVRHFREQENLRFWPGVWRRWLLALAFALASAAAFGAGYAWWTDLTLPSSRSSDSTQHSSVRSSPGLRWGPIESATGQTQKLTATWLPNRDAAGDDSPSSGGTT